jgi:HAD superfamily hydrolase (TIGR01509 family)
MLGSSRTTVNRADRDRAKGFESMRDAILWDNDGVLVDTERLYYQATREMIARVGVDLSIDLYRQLLLVEGRSAWYLAEERGVPKAEIETLRAARDELYLALLTRGQIAVPGAFELLERLKPRYRMAVVTSSKRVHFDAIHRHTRLRELVEFVLVREDYQHSKPHPEPYLRAVEKLGLPRAHCLVVEDSVRGLRAARAAKLRCWIVRTELTAGLDFGAAERCFSSLAELGEALLE